MADALDLGSGAERRAGSSPASLIRKVGSMDVGGFVRMTTGKIELTIREVIDMLRRLPEEDMDKRLILTMDGIERGIDDIQDKNRNSVMWD